MRWMMRNSLESCASRAARMYCRGTKMKERCLRCCEANSRLPHPNGVYMIPHSLLIPGWPAPLSPTSTWSKKQYVWNIDFKNLPSNFITSLANAIAALHVVDTEAAAKAGLKVSSPEQVRESMAAQMNRVKKELDVAEPLWQQWQAWLQDASYWPQHSCLVHGDLQAAHILTDASANVTGLLDWTEAEVSDPAIDFVVLLATFGESVIKDLIEAYQLAGGKHGPTCWRIFSSGRQCMGSRSRCLCWIQGRMITWKWPAQPWGFLNSCIAYPAGNSLLSLSAIFSPAKSQCHPESL